MYKVKYLVRIDTSSDEGKQIIHEATHNDANIEKVAKNFSSTGFKAVLSVKCTKDSDGELPKLKENEVIELFYPEEKKLPSGDMMKISDKDKERKAKAIAASKSPNTEKEEEAKDEEGKEYGEEEVEAMREEAKGLGIKGYHNMKPENLEKKIAEVKA